MAEQKVMKLAKRSTRFLSALTDSLIGMFVPIFLGAIFGDGVYGFACLAIIAVQIYFYTRAQSIGKRLFGIRVVREEDGQQLGIGYMLLREFILKPIINSFFCIGSLWILIDDRNCALYDKILNALVIDENGEEENIEGHYRTITEGNVTVAPTDDPIKNKVTYTMTAEEARAAYRGEKFAEADASETSETPNASEAPEAPSASETPKADAATASDAKPTVEPEAPKTVEPAAEQTAAPEIRTASDYLDDMKK